VSQKVPPYWIGNVTHIRLSRKHPCTGPNDTANQHGSKPVQKPFAKVLPLIVAKKKDVPQT
jgi:hypothetical protein